MADDLGPLRGALPSFACRDTGTCAVDCERDIADGCFGHALDLQTSSKPTVAAIDVFARSCRLGLAIGCTNFAASHWAMPSGTSPVPVRCVGSIFQRACDVREQWGCGMVGRFLSTYARTDAERAKARAHFDRWCNDLGGVPCRMYAYHLELGELGAHDPATRKALLTRACETGDDLACGVEQASDTFE